MTGSQGSCTPTTAYEAFSPDYDVKPQIATYNNETAVVTPLPNIYVGLPMRSTYHSGAPMTNSPQSGQDWMSNASSEPIEIQSVAKHPRIQSPTYHSNPPHMRPDGIRKKNARFEIPAERTLRTIDNLINQTNDEQIIKELKQQKRLLRNRQAALVCFFFFSFSFLPLIKKSTAYTDQEKKNRLDSRQRKKQHTERLEEEKKQTSTIINELEVELGEMKLREAEWAREREALLVHNRSLQGYVDELNMEKEDLVRLHTIEMGELRKKNTLLTEHAQKFESMSMSGVPSSAGYSTEFSDFDHLAIENGGWDNFSVVNDFNMETEARQENSLVVLSKKEKLVGKDEDKNTASSLLLMLLLCGAWVASNSTSSAPAPTPRVSDDVRVASTIVLENIYRDAGLQPLQSPILTGHRAVEKQMAQSSMKTTLSAVEIANLSNSPLASLHHQLITPSAEQQRDQAFSLSANQYNGISSGDFFHDQKSPLHAPRKSIAETLANMRSDKHAPAAEIYTRSLLWDEIPATVVRDFARMVAESHPGSARQENVEPMS